MASRDLCPPGGFAEIASNSRLTLFYGGRWRAYAREVRKEGSYVNCCCCLYSPLAAEHTLVYSPLLMFTPKPKSDFSKSHDVLLHNVIKQKSLLFEMSSLWAQTLKEPKLPVLTAYFDRPSSVADCQALT